MNFVFYMFSSLVGSFIGVGCLFMAIVFFYKKSMAKKFDFTKGGEK